ncbi:hypothetical protein LWF01_16695 [Saxibacter everestensis]|uniref:Uncharacterized protein n=1 Tax=Saxibacter everestensis TaxID=2909229 RepID=A0ABY8QTZ8_9MICO|nr:hypothetical protein LWF01_16695 [Brevibacteriaceae bacterium ZFBP1038]
MTSTLSTSLSARRIYGSPAQIITVACAGLAAMLSIVSYTVLPERFLLDNSHIAEAIVSPLAAEETPSFRNIAAIYRSLGFAEQPALAALVSLVLFTVAVFAATRWSRLAQFGVIGLAVVGISFVLAVAYLAQYSKEVLTLVIVLVLLVMPRKPYADAILALLMVGYGLFLRPYWVIIAGMYLVWRILLPRLKNPLLVIGAVAVGYALLEIAFRTVLSVGLTSNRAEINASRVDDDVASLIVDPLPTDGALAAVNATALLLMLLVPVTLVVTGNLFHVVSAVVIAFLWLTAIVGYIRLRREGNATTLAGRPDFAGAPNGTAPNDTASNGAYPPGAPATIRAARAAALLFAVVFVQAIFEPDFGSYLKHLTPLLPLFLTLVPLKSRSESKP